MTHRPSSLFKRPPSGSLRRPSAGQVAYCLMSCFCLVLILRNSDAAVDYMGRGLTLCATTVIPSLFPFMVISELLVASGAGEALGRLFSRVMKWIFGLSGSGASALFLGSLCGFPVGAKTAVSLYDRNMISKSECEHLLTFVSNPSSAFLITAVGISLFGNRNLGMVLYATVLGSGFLVGFLARFFLRRHDEPTEHPHFPSGLHVGGVETFTGAVTSAADGMMTVCAYVIFFSALTGVLGCMFKPATPTGELLYTCLYGFLEMTGGISLASTLGGVEMGVILAAAFAGWSGISVHCQVLTLCGGRGLSFRPYILAKAAQGILCGCIMAVLLRINPDWLSPAVGTVMDAIAALSSWKEITLPAMVTNAVFGVGFVLSRLWALAEKKAAR